MGPIVLLENKIEKYEIIVTSTPQEHFDLAMFKHIGVDPTAANVNYLILKSRMYCRSVLVH